MLSKDAAKVVASNPVTKRYPKGFARCEVCICVFVWVHRQHTREWHLLNSHPHDELKLGHSVALNLQIGTGQGDATGS